MGRTHRILAADLRPLLVVTAALLALTVVAYPLAVTGFGQLFFNSEANGSILREGDAAIGSRLIGQTFEGRAYFQGRPSAAGDGYDASASSGSNLGPSSATLAELLAARAAAYRELNGVPEGVPLPADALTASASGLDPHISPANARLQVARVAAERGVPGDEVAALVDTQIEGRTLGIVGEPRVNVLELNLALDAAFPLP